MPVLESNPLFLRQQDERVVGPIQLLDTDGTPHNLSVANLALRWAAFDRPGGTELFTLTSESLAASGGKLLISTSKESGHFYASMSSNKISTSSPGYYPTEIFYKSGNVARTVPGPMLILVEKLA